MPEEPLSDDQRERVLDFLQQTDAALAPVLKKSIIPIWAVQNELPIQCGTGTLLRVADKRFLLTAAHVTDYNTEHGLGFYISDDADGTALVQLTGNIKRVQEVDVSVVALSQNVVEKLSSREFLTLADFDRGQVRPQDGWYLVHGFPTELSSSSLEERRVNVKTFSFGTKRFSESTSLLDKYNPEVHLLLDAPSEETFFSDGTRAKPPQSLGGISGCSVWHVWCPSIAMDEWKVEDAKIVGVQTGWYKRAGAIKATHWSLVEQTLREGYPELEPALRLVTPAFRSRPSEGT